MNSIVFLQPPLLQSKMETDVVQEEYWKVIAESVRKIFIEKGLEEKLYKMKGNFTGFHEPNIGLLYIASILKRKGYDISYFDFHLMDAEIRNEVKRPIALRDMEETLKRCISAETKIVCMSPLTVNCSISLKLAAIIKGINQDTTIILGGPHVTFQYSDILKENPYVDVIVIGEGEDTITELTEVIFKEGLQPDKLQNIKGLAYKSSGEVVYTGKRGRIANLDDLPYPAYELLPEDYLENAILRVITSRGCNNNCSFCVPSKMFQKVIFRDPGKVIDEIEYLTKRFKTKTFMIGDLNFLNDYEYSKRFCQILRERKLDILWMCQSRTDLIDESVAKLMYEAGCVMVCLGIESADENVLDQSNKRITPEGSIGACRIAKDAGLKIFTYWAFGLPGETHDSAFRSIKLLRKLLKEKLIDYTHCTMVVPYPGTPLYNNPDKYGLKILSYDFDQYWLGCDYLGAGVPTVETKELTNWEIYGYWQLAMATVAGNMHR